MKIPFCESGVGCPIHEQLGHPCLAYNVTTFPRSLCMLKNFNFSEFFLRGGPPVAEGNSGGSSPASARRGFGRVARKVVFLLFGILHSIIRLRRVVFEKIPDNPLDVVPFLTHWHELTIICTLVPSTKPAMLCNVE